MASTANGSRPLDTSPHKRKHSTTEDGEGRVVKHRSSKACRSCRTRKVRCDVSAKGSRCTNCELDHLECVVLPSRRGQSNRIRHGSTGSTTQTHSFHNVNGGLNAELTAPAESKKDLQLNPPLAAPEGSGHVPAVVTFDDDADNTESERQADAAANGLEVGPSENYESLLTPETGTNIAPLQPQSPDGKALLPAFIAPLPTRILPEDLAFLSQKGAFVLPEPELCVEILRAYLFSVHPFMPMLNVGQFVRALLAEDGQISLLLFQAVMFAGLHSLRQDIVQHLGFHSPKQAREVYFNRVRLLYDFNIETDNAAILQSLILMSSWYSKHTPWNERRHTWHWTGLAYDLARSMGLHREPASDYFSAEMRCFRRRLWWSLYIRDRLIALGTRRPMRIHDNEFDVGILSPDDFEVEPFEGHGRITLLSPSKEENTSTALMCIQLARLCVHIGNVVSSQYTTLGTQAGASHTMMVMPRRNGDHSRELEKCEQDLQEWSEGLAGNGRRIEQRPAGEDPRSCSEIQWAQLNMTYLTVVNVLHRAQALRSEKGRTSSGAASSRAKVKNAARSITRLAQDMLQHDQVRFLGLIGVTALLAACLTHMQDVLAADEDVRDASTYRLYQSLQVLQSLRDVYASADSAFSFLASVTRKAGIYLPIQANPSATTVVSSSPSNMARIWAQESPRQVSNSSGGGRQGSLNEHQLARSLMRGFHTFKQSGSPQAGQRAAEAAQGMLISDPRQTPAASDPQSNYLMSFSGSSSTPTNVQGFVGVGTEPSNAQLQNMGMAGFSNTAPDGSLLDWNNNVDAGMGLGSLPFTYDFFSDAFGFLDGDLQGI